MVVHGGFTGSCGMCTPLQNKTIQNSHVLGYGQLNGHVASIVSMFSKRMFWKRNCTWEVLAKRIMYLGGTDDEKPDLSFQKFYKEKPFFFSLSLTKTSWKCDIHERNYYIFLKYLFQQRYRF